ncbi:MAG: lipid A deacylase LpxR family protein [Pseudomonadota bacterium]
MARSGVTALLACALAAGPVQALAAPDGPTVSFVWENDSFANTDRNYTNGVRLSWLSGEREAQGISGWIAAQMGAEPGTVRRRGFAIGHTLFTPREIDVAEFLPDQHPYAGYAYVEANAVLEQSRRIDTFTAQLGLVGPSAQGEFLQNEFHDLIGVAEAKGWDNQIGDEVGLNLSFDRKQRVRSRDVFEDLQADLTPNFGFTVGTLRTHAHGGLTLRLGQGLRADYGPPRVSPSLGGAGYFRRSPGLSWYVYGGVEGRAVAHDMIREGSLFGGDARSIDPERFVADLQFGFVVQYDAVQVSFTGVRRTKEFEQQNGAQKWGAFTVSRKF